MSNRRQPTPEQYPEILERAADILESEQVTWCQGTYFRRDFKGYHSLTASDYYPPLSACALGAIRIAAIGEDATYRELTDGMPAWWGEVEAELDDVLQEYLNRNIPLQLDYPDWGGMAMYNDVKGREKAEVIEVFKQVAKDLRNAANQ